MLALCDSTNNFVHCHDKKRTKKISPAQYILFPRTINAQSLLNSSNYKSDGTMSIVFL